MRDIALVSGHGSLSRESSRNVYWWMFCDYEYWTCKLSLTFLFAMLKRLYDIINLNFVVYNMNYEIHMAFVMAKEALLSTPIT